MVEIRKRAVEGVQAGDRFSISRTFTEDDVRRFAEISGDRNPVHFVDRFARVKNFAGPVCHGLLVATLLTEIGGDLGWLASSMTLRFVRPVYPGDTVRCDLLITSIDDRNRAEAEVVCTNTNGTEVLQAVLTGIVPGEVEREIMKEIERTREHKEHDGS